MGYVYALIVIVIVIAIIIGISKGKQNADRWNAEYANGNMIKRENKFWDEEIYFFTTASYEDVKKSISDTSFSSCKVTVNPDFEGYKAVLFSPNPRYWTAILEYVGESNGKNLFKYYIYSYVDNKLGIVVGDMNICQTKVEKTFLSLDTGTTTETHVLQRHTKRSWF